MISDKKYKLIYADPPWSYDNKKTGESMVSGADSKYDTLPLEELKALPIPGISEKDSVLFMWAVVPLLPEAFDLMKAWGFRYKTAIFWRKIMSLGMGYWFRGQVELCLLGIKGEIPAFRCQKANFIQSKVRKHSRKPDEMYGLIESLNINPKIELFARERREGWDVFGNQLPGDMQTLLHNLNQK